MRLWRTGYTKLCWTGARRRKGRHRRRGTFARSARRCSGYGMRPGTTVPHFLYNFTNECSISMIRTGQNFYTLSRLRSMSQSSRCQKRWYVSFGIPGLTCGINVWTGNRSISVCVDGAHDKLGTGVCAPARREEKGFQGVSRGVAGRVA